MTVRLELVRHGPSAHIRDGVSLARAELEAWWVAYDSAGIVTTNRPPTELIAAAATATYVISSDLERAVTSARVLAPDRTLQVSGLLREVELPIPRWPGRLPLSGWAILTYFGWSYRLMRGTDASDEDRRRVTATADWLESLLADGSSAVVVTHGVFRRLLGRQLVARGWRSEKRRGGYSNWSSWGFSRG